MVTTQQQFDKRLQRVVAALCTSLHYQQCALYVHENVHEFCIRATSGLSQSQEDYLHQHPLSPVQAESMMNQAERVRDIYILSHAAPLWQNPRAAEYLMPETGAIDLLLIPLKSEQDTMLGILVLSHFYAENAEMTLTDEAHLFLSVFAEQAAMAIEEERLHKEAQRSNEERTALIEIGRALFVPSALQNLQDVYQTIYEQTSKIMPVDALFVSRYNHEHKTMTMEYLFDEGVVYPPFQYNSIPMWVEKLMFREVRTFSFGTAEDYSYFEDATRLPSIEDDDLFGNERPSQSLLFVPIFYGDELIGVLSAQSYQRHAYTKHHLELLEEIGVQAGIGLTNALLYTKLRQALEDAQKSERLTNHFLMTASHELRTPLTSVQGYLELLTTHRKVLSDEGKQHFVDLASRACEELVLLVGNVMDTGNVDKDRVSLRLERVQIQHAIQRITEILEPTFTMERRSLEVAIDGQLYVEADDLRLRQILLNVVGNALKYAPPPSKIVVTATSVERLTLEQRLAHANLSLPNAQNSCFVVIAVRDWGTGIAKEDIPRLFAKFVRLESAMNSTQRGAGLGLYLCRQLAEVMSGQIWVESAGIVGEGATFLLALPQTPS